MAIEWRSKGTKAHGPKASSIEKLGDPAGNSNPKAPSNAKKAYLNFFKSQKPALLIVNRVL